MKVHFQRLLVSLILIGVMSFSAFAQSYSTVLPEYCPVSGGAWIHAETSQGEAVAVVPDGYRIGTFGFAGQSGYDVANCTSSTVSGNIYFKSATGYYGSPSELQCRWSRMGTLEVYEPYRSGSGNTSYRWTSLPISVVYATNVDFMDDFGDRQNDFYRYTVDQQILILIFSAVLLFLLFKLLLRGWKA